jgi:hypothetical protein
MTVMTRFRTTGASTLALALALATGTTAFGPSAQAQQRQQQMQQAPAQQGMPMQPGTMGQGMAPGTMGQGMAPGTMGEGMAPGTMGEGGMWHMGPHMMSPEEMHQMMERMGGMMGQAMPMQPGMMGQGMMQPGMMGQGMSPGMMDQGMGPGMMGQGMGGWSGLEGRRVVPMVRLSTDDVRAFFERHLAALGNERLKVGAVEAMNGDTITADIVTVDDSLVESFQVDRRTGMISRAG